MTVGELHRSIIQRRWKEASEHLQTDEGKAEASIPFKDDLPLHMACERRAPTSLILDLLRAYPDGATQPGRGGCYALHHAAQMRATPDVLFALIKVYPDALDEMNHQQATPRYYRQTDPTSRDLLDKPTKCWHDFFNVERRQRLTDERITQLKEEKWRLKRKLEHLRPKSQILRTKVELIEPRVGTMMDRVDQLKHIEGRVEALEKECYEKAELFQRKVQEAEEMIHEELGRRNGNNDDNDNRDGDAAAATTTMRDEEEIRNEKRNQREYAESVWNEMERLEGELTKIREELDMLKEMVK